MLLPLARALDRPLVVSFYGFDASAGRFTKSRRWRRAYARLFDQAAGVLVEGPAMGERVEALGCPAELIEVIRLPADADALAEIEPRRGDAFTIVAAGRFIEKKGFDTAIEAFARCAAAMPDAKLCLVGGGELEAELRSQAAALGIALRVAFAGRLPFGEFMSAVGAADLALYPSRTASNGDSEGGAPVGLIEAQWLGVPSIVSDHDDLPFVCAPQGSVVLPPRDVDAWADALLDLYGDRARLAEMGKASARFVRELHSPEATGAQRESVYDAAIADRRAG